MGEQVIQYCIQIEKPELLFGEVYKRFNDSGTQECFLDLLEPFIIQGNEQMKIMPQNLFDSLVNHFINKGKLKELEQCIINLDLKNLNFDEVIYNYYFSNFLYQIISLCKKYKLYKAYLYAFNSVQEKYIEPLNVLFELIHEEYVANVLIDYIDICIHKLEVKKEMIKYLFFQGKHIDKR